MRGLPPDSNAQRAVDPWPEWSTDRELLAQLVELTSVGLARRGLRAPLSVPRPPRAPRTHVHRRRSSPAELGAFFGGRVRVVDS